jgi:hypothetical protein
MRLTLTPHPDTPCTAISSIEVKIVRTRDAGIELHYFAMGAIRNVRWPAPAVPERCDRLWEASCFELFVKMAGRPAYLEFNFAPSTRWACYRFDEYRSGMQMVPVTMPPRIATRITAKTHVLTATLALSQFRGYAEGADWAVALSAVIEETNGSKSYWALKHPPGKPDFHHPDCFALTLAAPIRP